MHVKHGVNGLPPRRRRAALAGLSVLALVGLCAPEARADVLAFSTNVIAQTFDVGKPMDLSAATGVQRTLSFTTPKRDLVAITFSAECSVTGPVSNTGSIAIEVKVAGATGFVPIVPTAGNDDAFCSGNETDGNDDGLVTASMTVVTKVPAGTHEVLVLAAPVPFPGPTLRLDDLSITVDN